MKSKSRPFGEMHMNLKEAPTYWTHEEEETWADLGSPSSDEVPDWWCFLYIFKCFPLSSCTLFPLRPVRSRVGVLCPRVSLTPILCVGCTPSQHAISHFPMHYCASRLTLSFSWKFPLMFKPILFPFSHQISILKMLHRRPSLIGLSVFSCLLLISPTPL